MVTDLLALAWENAWEVAILLSSDRDFIPAIQMLACEISPCASFTALPTTR